MLRTLFSSSWLSNLAVCHRQETFSQKKKQSSRLSLSRTLSAFILSHVSTHLLHISSRSQPWRRNDSWSSDLRRIGRSEATDSDYSSASLLPSLLVLHPPLLHQRGMKSVLASSSSFHNFSCGIKYVKRSEGTFSSAEGFPKCKFRRLSSAK